jgi:NAD(P)-dependent dehydrogenase (short-subunit alcohol dehydrogenase family)
MREQLTEKGHIDGIFASAGVGNLMEPFGTVTAESFDPTFTHSYVNARGTLFIVQKALAFLRDHASIILNGAAGSGGRGFPAITVCAAAKQLSVHSRARGPQLCRIARSA